MLQKKDAAAASILAPRFQSYNFNRPPTSCSSSPMASMFGAIWPGCPYLPAGTCCIFDVLVHRVAIPIAGWVC